MNATDQVNAFSPTGAKILSVLEFGLQPFPVQTFYRDVDEAFHHEYADGWTGRHADTDPIEIDGSTVFVDNKGTYWLESALTFKTADGTVVHQGEDQPPVTLPDINQAITHASQGLTTDVWDAAEKLMDAIDGVTEQFAPEIAALRAALDRLHPSQTRQADNDVEHPRQRG